MEQLDDLRVTKLKCLSCGCRDKRIAIRRDRNNRKVSFSTICCNCGEVRNYIFRDHNFKRDASHSIISDVDILKHLSDQETITEIFCAIPGKFCLNTECPLHHHRPLKELTYGDIMYCENNFQSYKINNEEKPKEKFR